METFSALLALCAGNSPVTGAIDGSILVRVMAWCQQATSHYLNQFWPSSMWPYGIDRPRVNSFTPSDTKMHGWYSSVLVQPIAYCLGAPSHYLILCYLIFNKIPGKTSTHFSVTDPAGTKPFPEQMLTHWVRETMAAIFQTTFSTAFSWMKTFESRLIFYWILFLMVQLTIS